MSLRPPSRRSGARGFTLLEALVALGLLMIGVYAVLRIFPLGLSTVAYTRNVQLAARLAEREVERLLAEPSNLPDRIIATDGVGTILNYDPDDFVYDAASYATGQATVTNGSAGVSGNGTQWLTAAGKALPGCLFEADGSGTWYVVLSVETDTQLTLDRPYAGSTGTVDYKIERPSWEPDGIFLPRSIVGETVEIPRLAPAAGLREVPKHILAFGPILPWSQAEPAIVYSTRYRAIDDPGELSSGEDRFQYVIDDATGVLTFDSAPYERSFKVDYSWVERGAGSGEKTTRSRVGETFTLSASQTVYTLAEIVGPDQRVVSGSERIFRTFAYDASGTPSRGEFSMTALDRILGVVRFSADDALTTVMIDYRVADWQVMHQDRPVPAGGEVRLAVAPLRSADYRNEPREPVALYVDWPNSHDVVAVDLDSAEALYGAAGAQDFGTPDAAGYVGTFGVDYKNGLLQFNQGAADRTGRTYRIFYRAVENWGVRASRAAGRYYDLNDLAAGAGSDQIFTRSAATLTFPLSERGKSVMVDYTYQPAGAGASDSYVRVSGELHTIPATGETDAGVIELDIGSGDTLVGVNRVVGASLTATAAWANNRRRSLAKNDVPLQEKVAVRRVETFGATR